jgi:predicted dehydrogenase
MRIALVGTGFVADLYMRTLSLHPGLEVAGVMDRDEERARRFARHYSLPFYPTLDALLAESGADIFLNLTNPASHYAVSRACLEAGKHVYSEKPLALSAEEARDLVQLAGERGARLSGAPSRVLGESAQTMWRALRGGVIGKPRLVYAEMDDGMLHQMAFRSWKSVSGTPWPYKNEFETGCTLEHAGYVLSWLLAFFGPVEHVTAYADCRVAKEETGVELGTKAPDFSVGCLRFRSGVVARLTCSVVAPKDHSIRIVGDSGVMYLKDCWRPREPVYVRSRFTVRRKTIEMPWGRKLPLLGTPELRRNSKGLKKVDFLIGVKELAEAIQDGRPSRLSESFCLHMTEVALALSDASPNGCNLAIESTFPPMPPMRWAK